VDDAERRIFSLAERRLEGSAQPVGKILKSTLEHLELLHERKEAITGVASGFEELDAQTSGFQPSDFVILAGRPSTGKTALALNVAQHVGIALRGRVLILSFEMSASQLVQRLLCSEARVDSHAVRTGRLTTSDWHRLTAAAGRLSEASIFIDDSPWLTVLEARAKARRMKAEHGLDLLIIDYLQLMRGRRAMENRQQEVSEISRSLKALAKELNVPVVALSQLSRAVEARQAREFRPQLSDLRESGSLEQDSDVVLLLYRPSMYKDDVPPEEKDLTEVIIAKQRNGPMGVVPVAFLPQYALSFARTGSGSLEGRPSSSDRLKTMATGTRPRRVHALPMSTLPAETRFSGYGGWPEGRAEPVARAGGVEDRPVWNYAARRR